MAERFTVTRKVGLILGEKVLRPLANLEGRRVGRFEIHALGTENLQGLEERPFLLVANHLIPDTAISQEMGNSPDAFVIERVVRKAIQRKPLIVVKSDSGWWSANQAIRKMQKAYQPFGQALMEGAGFVPILKNPGSRNANFLRVVDRLVGCGQSLLIFPEGDWYTDFSPDHYIEPGAAHLSKKYNLPIVPIYIRGATSWKSGTKVDVVIGEAFEAIGKSRSEINEQIRESLSNLQSSLTGTK